jgi:hypothetical protein
VDSTILQAESNDATTLPVLHQQIQSKVLDEVVAVIPSHTNRIFKKLKGKKQIYRYVYRDLEILPK